MDKNNLFVFLHDCDVTVANQFSLQIVWKSSFIIYKNGFVVKPRDRASADFLNEGIRTLIEVHAVWPVVRAKSFLKLKQKFTPFLK